MSISMESNTVVVVGAGPTGLMQTAHMHLLGEIEGRKLKYVVLEGRTGEYTRKHTVYLGKSSLQKLVLRVNGIQDKALLAKVEAFNNLVLSRVVGNIRTSVLERTLSDFVQNSLGIEVRRGDRVDSSNFDAIIREYNPVAVVAAGGAHCVVSRHLFPTGRNREHDLQHILKISFSKDPDVSVPGRIITAHHNALTGYYSPAPSESRDRAKGTTFYFVNKRIYEEFRGINSKEIDGRVRPSTDFKNPLTVDEVTEYIDQKEEVNKFESSVSQRTHFELLRDRFKHDLEAMTAVKGTEQIVSVRLYTYSSKEYAKEVTLDGEKFAVLKVGDAAAGVPFQRSLNAGYEIIAHCTKSIFGYIDSGSERLELYNRKADKKWSWEVFRARVTNIYVVLASLYHKVTGVFFEFWRSLFSAITGR